MTLDIARDVDPERFTERVTPFLLAHEAEHNLILGVLSFVIRVAQEGRTGGGGGGGGPAERPPPYLATVEGGGGVLAVAVRTPPHRLLLSRIGPDDPQRVVDRLVEDLAGEGPDLSGVVGPAAVAGLFARTWSRRSGRPAVRETALRIFKLVVVEPGQPVPGALRPATAADADLVARWVVAFRRDIGETSGGAQAEETAEETAEARRIADGSIRSGGLHLWELDAGGATGGGPVSMANATGPTPNGIRINMVYTPPEHRRRGYAGAAVGALSQAMLDAGRRFCFLYTDLANPTTNRIYPRLGYRPVADADAYDFPAPGRSHR